MTSTEEREVNTQKAEFFRALTVLVGKLNHLADMLAEKIAQDAKAESDRRRSPR